MANVKGDVRKASRKRAEQLVELAKIEENLKLAVANNMKNIDKSKAEVQKHIQELQKTLVSGVEMHRQQVLSVQYENLLGIRATEEILKQSLINQRV